MTGGKKREKTARGKQGFTLVELLIVITILVIMISIMAVAAGPIMSVVQRASCQSQLKALAQVYLNYATQSSITFPSLNGSDTSKGTPPSGGGNSGFDNLIYNGASGGYAVGFGPLSWQQLVAASYYVCPAVTGRDQWWHDSAGGGDDYWQQNPNSNPDTCIQVNINSNPPGAPTTGNTIISSYSIRPGLYGWTPSQVMMQHGTANLPAYRAFIADSFYVDQNLPQPQLCVTSRHRDGVNVAYLDGTVKYCNFSFLTQTTAQPTSTIGSTLDRMWEDFDLN